MQIDYPILVTYIGKERDETIVDPGIDCIQYEALERVGAKLVAGDFALSCPEMAVDGEDSIADEFVEDAPIPKAFDVVREVGDEKVLDVERVSRTDTTGEVEEGVDLESGGRSLR